MSIFTSTMDSEVLVHRMARSSAEKPEQRLADASEPPSFRTLLCRVSHCVAKTSNRAAVCKQGYSILTLPQQRIEKLPAKSS